MEYGKMLNAIFKEATVGIIIVDKTGTIVQNNPYLETLFGYEAGELQGSKLEVLLPKKYKKGHVKHRDQYLQKPRARSMGTHQELFGLKKDGSKFPVEISLSYSNIDDQLYAIGYVSDNSQEKRILNQLRESKSRLDQAQRLAHIGNFEIDWHSKKAIWSDEMYRIFGMDKKVEAELFVYDLIKFIHPDDKQKVLENTASIIANKKGSNIDFRIKTQNNKIKYIHAVRDVQLDQDENVIKLIGVLQDVSRLKRVEIELNNKIDKIKQVEVELLQLNEALEIKVEERTSEIEETVNRLLKTNSVLEERELQLKEALNKEKELNELKSRFVSMASHEFRTPLSTILSSASLVSRYVSEEHNEKRQKHINRIKSSVSNLTGILNDFLSLSKIEEGKEVVSFEKIDLKQLLLLTIDETKGLLKLNQQIKLNISDNHLLTTDKRIFKNVLFNLFSNAIKYSPEDSTILCNVIKSKNKFKIEITDQGIGIPEQDQKHLFSRFFRASNVENIQGTGLGLNIVKRYIELLGGSISFTSQEFKGTTFKIIIPVDYEEDISNRR